MFELMLSLKKQVSSVTPDPAHVDNAAFTAAASSTYGFHHAPVVVGRRLYHFGVYTGSASNAARYYDADTNTFTSIAGTPTSVYGAAAVHYNGKIYIFGGTRADGTNNVIIYDIASNTYSRGPTTLPGMTFFGIAVKDDNVYMAGVDNTSNLYKYNLTTHALETINIGTVVCNGATCSIVGDYLYVQGGRTAANAHLTTSYRVKLDTHAVEQLAPLPKALMMAWSRFVYGSLIVYTGAHESSSVSSTTHGFFYYDTETNTYKVLTTPASTRNYSWSGLIDTTYYMFAGIRNGTGLSDSIKLTLAI